MSGRQAQTHFPTSSPIAIERTCVRNPLRISLRRTDADLRRKVVQLTYSDELRKFLMSDAWLGLARHASIGFGRYATLIKSTLRCKLFCFSIEMFLLAKTGAGRALYPRIIFIDNSATLGGAMRLEECDLLLCQFSNI